MIEQFSQKNSRGVEYFLNKKTVDLRNGAKSVVWYFSRDLRPETSSALPDNKQVIESTRSYMLMIKNK